MTNPHDYVEANKTRFLEQLKILLRMPSISTLPEHTEDVLHAAQWLKDEMLNVGMDTAEIITMPEGRHPMVLGEWHGAGDDAPTVLLYCHYDVQPAVMEDGWHTSPFEPTEQDGKLYARGAVDSKLHVIAGLKAIEALLASDDKSPVNIKLLLEGEEESGSETINAFIEQNPDRLKADVGIISDGSILDAKQPSLLYALRGIIGMELHVSGPAQDLHSGHFGGNTHNPIQALSEIIAQLHDKNGHVTVPGFYDDVVELDADERADLAKINPYIEAEWRAVANAPQPYGEPDYTLHERAGARPTLEINGIAGGFYGTGFKTVLPQKAFAKISCRLVANQNPQQVYDCIRDYIAQIAPPTVKAELIQLDLGSPAVVIDRHSRAMLAASDAYTYGWGTKPIYERAGGSVPITYALMPICTEMVMLPFGYKSGKAHGPNEHIHIESLYRGIHTAIYFLQDIARRFQET